MAVDLDQIIGKFNEVQSNIANALQQTADPESQEYLQNLRSHLQGAQSRYVDAFRSAAAEHAQQKAENAQAMEKAKAAIATAKEQVAAKKAAAAEKAAKLPAKEPDPEIDPKLGRTLREELLQKFGAKNEAPDPRGGDDIEEWDDWLDEK